MDYKIFILLIAIATASCLSTIYAQHEDIPYENVENICERCVCLTVQDTDKRSHYMLSCAMKNFQHILARWPQEFGSNHSDVDIVVTFSGNKIELLQQLPATTAALTFSCRHCGIMNIQVPTFMDVPNVRRLDLSWNVIKSDALSPDVFRGPYRTTYYEPIALQELDLSHNQLGMLDKKLFEHTPNLTRLDLSHNSFGILDTTTVLALASAKSLEMLDLSYTGLSSLPEPIFQALVHLKTLNLAGNAFTRLPTNLQMAGRTLQVLNLAGNQMERFGEHSFLGLKVLHRLNISDMPTLKYIDNGTFTRLETLEFLHCSHNPNLQKFDLDSLMHCSNLTELDVSYCNLNTLTINMDLSKVLSSNSNSSNATTITPIEGPWPKLHRFETVGNPWLCDCALLQTLEYAGGHHRYKELETRCDSPYILAGAKMSNLTSELVCSMRIPRKYRIVDEDPPRFLRKRYIILTAITASVVIILGLIIGFLVVCIRRRLKNDDFGVEPIRYTSVRSSNLSAFSHVQAPNTATGHA